MKILIVEDEPSLREIMVRTLTREQYVVEQAADYAAALDKIAAYDYDCILLDIMLPGGSGLRLLEELKRRRSPAAVIIISARDSLDDKIEGLELGADDYLPKPFHLEELSARIRSVLRRCGKSQAVVTLGNVTVDTEKGVATKGGNDLYLSALEYRLLLVFVNNRGKVLSRSKLLEEIWDVAGDFVNDNTLTVYIKRLREKIEDDPQSPQIIRTVRGMGYKMDG